jgi:multicomponent K+:H+ antiporter subunit F
MIETAVLIGFVMVAAAMLLDFYRIVRGPDLPDRVLGLDTLTYNAIALLMLTGIHFDRDSYFAAALVIGMLGFVSTVALSSYLLRGTVIE